MPTNITTHDGQFHADEVFAIACIGLLHDDTTVTRTRDRDHLAAAQADPTTYVVDIGHVHEPATLCFDHHQAGFALTHDHERIKGTTFASFGLVWHALGARVLHAMGVDNTHVPFVHAHVMNYLVGQIDAADNGQARITAHLKGTDQRLPITTLSAVIGGMNFIPGQDQFDQAISVATSMVHSVVSTAVRKITAREVVDRCDEGTPILILDTPDVAWRGFTKEHHHFVISERADGNWVALTVSTPEDHFTPKTPFPSSWAGLENEDLAKVSGFDDAVFCHRGLFIAVAGSWQTALAMARSALQERM